MGGRPASMPVGARSGAKRRQIPGHFRQETRRKSLKNQQDGRFPSVEGVARGERFLHRHRTKVVRGQGLRELRAIPVESRDRLRVAEMRAVNQSPDCCAAWRLRLEPLHRVTD